MEPEKRYSLYTDYISENLNKRLLVDLKKHNWLTSKIIKNNFKHKDREKGQLQPFKEADLPKDYGTKTLTVAFLRINLRIKKKVLAQTPDGVLTSWQVKKKILVLESSQSADPRNIPCSLSKLRSHTTSFETFVWTPRHTSARTSNT